MKACAKCKREYPATNRFFRKHSGFPDGLGNRCKNCEAEYARGRREICNAARRERRRANPKAVSVIHRIERYGIGPDDVDLLRQRQHGKCGICGKHESAMRGGLHIDHDHATNAVRGLLCLPCNMHIGRFGARRGFEAESAAWLRK